MNPKQREYSSIEEVRDYIEEIRLETVFLVTGKSSYISSSAKDKLDRILANWDVTRYSNFSTNPKLDEAIEIFDVYTDLNPDIIIAVGGGSVMDMAKLIKGLSGEKDPERSILENKILGSNTPFIAIPTTSGSGSEATPFAVVYVEGTKYSLQDPSLLPGVVVLDPTLTESQSSYQTATSGMDALSQGIESFWSINATDKSRKYSSKAISLTLENLEQAVNQPNKSNRESMLIASNQAGKAIAIAKTTAPHAISYPITSNFGIPHGHAVALTLPEILVYNANVTKDDSNHPGGHLYTQSQMNQLVKIIGVENSIKARAKILNLMENIDLKTTLSQLNIHDSQLIIDQGFNPQRMKNNPRIIEEKDLAEILKNIA